MIRNAATLIAAMLAAPALAQESVSITLTHGMDSNVVEIGQVVTWSLTMEHAGFQDGAINGSIFAALIPSNDDLGFASNFEYNPSFNGGNNGGTAEAMGFELLNFTNTYLVHFAPPALPDNPLIVGTFTTTITDTGSGPLTYQLAQTSQSGQPIAVVELNAFASTTLTLDQIDFSSDFIVIPAPGAALPLAPAAMLAAGRRRR